MNSTSTERICPDYNGGSIVNVISSIQKSCGVGARYPTATLLAPEQLRDKRHIVFILVDGLGYNYLQQHGRDSFLFSHLRGKLTSVFPSTTSTAVTSLATGVPAAQHAVTGWFMYLRELGNVSAILPFMPRSGGQPYDRCGVDIQSIVSIQPIYSQLPRRCTVINPDFITESVYNRMLTRGASRIGIKTFEEGLRRVTDTINLSEDPSYTHYYWSELDHLCHEYGVDSEQARQEFCRIDRAMQQWTESFKRSDTVIVITADHGLIDTASDRVLHIEQWPDFQNMLRLPLCGEPRTAYCYVKPEAFTAFASWVTAHWSEYCDVTTCRECIERGWYGDKKAIHPELHDRIGDFVLLMKDNYIIKDRIAGEKSFKQIGVHGGQSSAEMYVPLIVI